MANNKSTYSACHRMSGEAFRAKETVQKNGFELTT